MTLYYYCTDTCNANLLSLLQRPQADNCSDPPKPGVDPPPNVAVWKGPVVHFVAKGGIVALGVSQLWRDVNVSLQVQGDQVALPLKVGSQPGVVVQERG